jgi:hypothetical protein
MFRAVPFLIALCAFFAASCVSSIETRSAGASATPLFAGRAGDPEPELCVMEVPGTDIDMDQTREGIVLTFETVAPESVADLRAAVRRFGDEYAAGAPTHDHHRHSARASELARAYRAHAIVLPRVETSVTDVPDGARLFLRTSSAAARAQLAARLRGDVGEMHSGVCPLLQ